MPNEKLKLQNMESALSAAYDCFLEVGIENTTNRMISDRSGVSLRSVARYFPTKTDLIRMVADRAGEIVVGKYPVTVDALRITGMKGIDLLRSYMETIKKTYLRDSRFFALRVEFDVYFSRHGSNRSIGQDYLTRVLNAREIFSEIFRLGTEDGSIRKAIDVDRETDFICSAYFSFLSFLSLSVGYSESDSEMTVLRLINNFIDQNITAYAMMF